jgi:hypothetical protein
MVDPRPIRKAPRGTFVVTSYVAGWLVTWPLLSFLLVFRRRRHYDSLSNGANHLSALRTTQNT